MAQGRKKTKKTNKQTNKQKNKNRVQNDIKIFLRKKKKIKEEYGCN